MSRPAWFPRARTRPTMWEVGLFDGEEEILALGPMSRAMAEDHFRLLNHSAPAGMTPYIRPVSRRDQ